MQQDPGFPEFFGEAFKLCRENPLEVGAYVGVLSVFGIGVDFLTREPEFFADAPAETIVAGAFGMVAVVIILMVILSYLLVAALLRSRGEVPQAGSRFWAYIGYTIVAGLGVLLGFLLLVVPGLILMTRWIAAPGYVVGRERGITEALRDSWDLTSGKAWPIFGGIVLIFVANAMISGVFEGIALTMPTTIALIASTVSNVVANLAGAIGLAFGIAVFCLLDRNADETADVFA